jgi:transcriptional regulator with XRE-family HTH domain
MEGALMPTKSRKNAAGDSTWRPEDIRSWEESAVEALHRNPHARTQAGLPPDTLKDLKARRQKLREAFGRRLRHLIDQSGLMDSEVGRAIGVERFSIHDWTSGRKYPRAESIARLAKHFGVTEDYLRHGKTAEPAPVAEKGEIYWMARDEKDPSKSLLHVNCVTSTPLARQILAMLATDDTHAAADGS